MKEVISKSLSIARALHIIIFHRVLLLVVALHFIVIRFTGERQAEITGKRLKELNFEYDVMINSTMTRATQTSNIIAKQLPEVPRKSCDMLREGAPYPPEPPTGDWKPEAYVS